MGLGEPDDAAVWRLDEQRALVATTDFFTPVVDNPYDYGAIAATNALSDVYAMGGQPFLALNIAAMPTDLPQEMIAEIVRGGAEKIRQAGAVLAGGHTVQDKEPKFGYIVLGFVDPAHMITKNGARPGDVLVISKPLGFGAISTALKRGLADPADIAEATDWMKRLNKVASELAVEFQARCGTDVTGFSLLGHGLEMANASGVGFHLSFAKIPILEGGRRYAEEWIFPGGSSDNRLYYGSQVQFDPEISEPSQMLLFDAQTSGGLLVAVPPGQVKAMLERASRAVQAFWVIGEVVEGGGIRVSA